MPSRNKPLIPCHPLFRAALSQVGEHLRRNGSLPVVPVAGHPQQVVPEPHTPTPRKSNVILPDLSGFSHLSTIGLSGPVCR